MDFHHCWTNGEHYSLPGGAMATTTMSTFVRYATSTQTTFTETVFVLPTSTTASTTSTFAFNLYDYNNCLSNPNDCGTNRKLKHQYNRI